MYTANTPTVKFSIGDKVEIVAEGWARSNNPVAVIDSIAYSRELDDWVYVVDNGVKCMADASGLKKLH